MKTYSNPQRNYILIALILSLGIGLVSMSLMIFDGIMGAIIFFTILRNPYIYFKEKKKWNNSLSAFLLMLISFLVLIVPFITLTLMVYDKIVFYETNPEELGVLKEKLWPIINKYFSSKKNVDAVINGIQSKFFILFSNTINRLSSILLQITVLYFLLYFMLKEHLALEKIMLQYLPIRKYQAQRLGTELTNITNSNLLGQGFICFVQGSLVTIGFLIFGISDPVFWGIVCFFLSFLPFIGAPLVFVPAGLIQYFAGNSFGGIGIILWGFILVTNIDNVIRFYLSKKIGDVHPLITIIGVIIGIPTFGILGLVYGPLLISYFILLVKIWEENKGRRV